MEIAYAIPSYQRANKQETLEYLNGMGIPKKDIYIFVQTKGDEALYQTHREKANIVYAPAQFVARARNNALNYLSGSSNVLMIDDDVKHFARMKENKLLPIKNKDEFLTEVTKCFMQIEKYGADIFGLYPVPNEFFMHDDISTKVTINTVMGFKKGFKLRFDESFIAKEDLELCGRIINSGGNVVRFNYLTAKAKHRTNAGGCKDIWASTENQKAVKRLCEMYPDIFAPHRTKDNEVRVVTKDVKI